MCELRIREEDEVEAEEEEDLITRFDDMRLKRKLKGRKRRRRIDFPLELGDYQITRLFLLSHPPLS